MRVHALLLTSFVLVLPALSGAGEPPEPRPRAASRPGRDLGERRALRELEAQLEGAVDRVSQPRPAALMGRGGTRGYRLPGYGVVLVLTPRSLPGPDGERDVLRPRTRVQLRRVAPRATGELESLERQVIVLQHETERARREAEADMERIVQELRVRVSSDADTEADAEPGVERRGAATREPTAEPAPSVHFEILSPPTPPGPFEAPRAPSAAGAPVPPAPPPPPPPWKFWFESSGPADSRSADAIVADVRQSILAALEARTQAVRGLRPEEFVAVAVDFEPAGLLLRAARQERTLVIRARVRDLDARSRGAIGPEELKRRIEVTEY